MDRTVERAAQQIISAYYKTLSPIARSLLDGTGSRSGVGARLAFGTWVLDRTAALTFCLEPGLRRSSLHHAVRILTSWHAEYTALDSAKVLATLVKCDPDYLYLPHFVDALLKPRRVGLDLMHRDDRDSLSEALASLFRVRSKKETGRRPRKAPPDNDLRAEYLAIQGELKEPSPVDRDPQSISWLFSTRQFRLGELRRTRRQHRLPDPDAHRREWEDALNSVLLKDMVVARCDENDAQLSGLAKVLVIHFPNISLKWSKSTRGYRGLGFEIDPHDARTTRLANDWGNVASDHHATAAQAILAAKYGVTPGSIADNAAKPTEPPSIETVDLRRNWRLVDALLPTAPHVLAGGPLVDKCGVGRNQILELLRGWKPT